MTLNIAFLPSAVQAAIQDGILERSFQGSLFPLLKWRMMADQELHPGRIGERVIKTRPGLIQPDTEASAKIVAGSDPTLATRSLEQYQYQVASYGKSLETDLPASFFAAASTYLDDVEKLGLHAAQTLGRIMRDRLVKAYSSGNAYALTGATSTSITVSNPVGFDTVLVNGVYVPVSASNPLPVTIGGNANTVTACNLTTGVLTLGTSATWLQYDAVVSADAPKVIREGNRATDRAIVAGDTATAATFRAAKAWLVRNAVPGINGRAENDIHVAFVSPDVQNSLFKDAEFHDAIKAIGLTGPFADGAIGDYAGIRFVPNAEYSQIDTTTLASLQTTIHDSFMFGAGVMVEAYVPETGIIGGSGAPAAVVDGNHYKRAMDPQGVITYVARQPMDALGRRLLHSWAANVDWVVPTDSLSLRNANRYKRGVLIRTAGPA